MADTPVEKATIGRIVRYVPNDGGAHLAAVVTKVEFGVGVNLAVFDEDGRLFQAYAILHDATFGPGTWHWPVRD